MQACPMPGPSELPQACPPLTSENRRYSYFRTQRATYTKIQFYPKIGMRLFLSIVYLAVVTKTWLGFWNFFLEQYNDLNLKSFIRCNFPTTNKNRKRILTTTTLPLPLLRGDLLCCHLSLTWLAWDFPSSNPKVIHTFISVWTKSISYRTGNCDILKYFKSKRKTAEAKELRSKALKSRNENRCQTSLKQVFTNSLHKAYFSQLLKYPVWFGASTSFKGHELL